MDHHENRLIGKLGNLMDDAYEHLTKTWKGGGIVLSPDAHKF
jgi:hypothetical protein